MNSTSELTYQDKDTYISNHEVLIYNPRATNYNPRIPNSVLQIAACIDAERSWTLVDGNLEQTPLESIYRYLRSGKFRFFASTVMPGPQLKQAIPFAKKIKQDFPDITIIWGGYFASNQFEVSLKSGFVDYIVNGPGDFIFPALLRKLDVAEDVADIPGICYVKDGKIVKNAKPPLPDMDLLQPLPYDKLNSFYPLSKILPKTYLGNRTIAYHSSFGCPFTCSFCAVVPIYNARWTAKSATKVFEDIMYLKENYQADAIEFHDNNFFVSEKRVLEFSKLMLNRNMNWWGEARIDTMSKYTNETLQTMRDSGCKMIFFGAETGNDEILKKMDKGGTQTGKQILDFAARLKSFDIIPEYSFVLGTPADSDDKVMKQINEDIDFIKKVKKANPKTEIIMYTYSPVPAEGSEMYKEVLASGFRFPSTLEDWISPQWENFDLRKNPLTPWLKPAMIDRIKNFETVLNGMYPSVSDVRLTPLKRAILKLFSTWRYQFNFFHTPKEISFLFRIWRYRQPEKEGF